jgi:EAL domain-containing protein (putative c-di-GMP-specific phosphodiesterase class I)
MMTSLVQYWKRENVRIIAEGLERQEEVAFFTEIGATFGQGYWFHKPEPVVSETKYEQEQMVGVQ